MIDRPRFESWRRLIVFVAVVALAGCALPRIVILHDPLTAEEHWKLGLSYQRAGEPTRASEEFTAGLRKDGNDPRLWLSVGYLHQIEGRTDAAEAAYRRTLQLQPDNALANNNLAWLLADRGAYLDAAEGYARRAVAADPARAAAYLDTLAVVFLKAGRIADAEQAIKQAAADPSLAIPGDLAQEIARTQDRIRAARTASGPPEHGP